VKDNELLKGPLNPPGLKKWPSVLFPRLLVSKDAGFTGDVEKDQADSGLEILVLLEVGFVFLFVGVVLLGVGVHQKTHLHQGSVGQGLRDSA